MVMPEDRATLCPWWRVCAAVFVSCTGHVHALKLSNCFYSEKCAAKIYNSAAVPVNVWQLREEEALTNFARRVVRKPLRGMCVCEHAGR